MFILGTVSKGTGISTRIDLTDRLFFGVGYTTTPSNAADSRVGLFQDFNLATNLNYSGEHFDLGLAYSRTQDGNNPNNPSLSQNLTQDAIGLTGAVRLSPELELGGFVTYVDWHSEDPNGNTFFNEEGWAFGTNLAVFDLGKEGSKLGIAFASPAFSQDAEIDGTILEVDRTWVAEVSYRFSINDEISVSPGVTAILNPQFNQKNDTVYVGAIQTTFSF